MATPPESTKRAPGRSTTFPVFHSVAEREAALATAEHPLPPAAPAFPEPEAHEHVPSFPEPQYAASPSFPEPSPVEPERGAWTAEPEAEDEGSVSDLPNPHSQGSDYYEYDAEDEKSALGGFGMPRRRATAPIAAPSGSRFALPSMQRAPRRTRTQTYRRTAKTIFPTASLTKTRTPPTQTQQRR